MSAAEPQGRTMPLASVQVGTRHRRDLGDIEGLAASIAEIGLLHPIVVRPDGTLIAGARRLEAVKRLDWTEIPVTVIDIDSIARGEYAENHFRKAFTPSEYADIADALEPIEREAARVRQGERTDKHPGKFPGSSMGSAQDKVARTVGKDRKTVQKARAVRDAARADPERFGKLQEDMDRTGRVDGVYKRLKVARQAEHIRAEPPPLPNGGPYRVVVIDVPWPYEPDQDDPSQRAVRPYPTMSLDQISDFARRLRPLLHADAIVWLWCTNFHLLRHAAPILDALGVSERAILTWVKDRFGYGHWLRSRTEQCILAVRGQPTVTLKNESTVLVAPVDRHSAKPPEFYSMVERLCPAPRYLDVFSRYRHSAQWDCFGDEAPPLEPPPNETVVTPTTTEVLPTPATSTTVVPTPTDDNLSIPNFLLRSTW